MALDCRSASRTPRLRYMRDGSGTTDRQTCVHQESGAGHKTELSDARYMTDYAISSGRAIRLRAWRPCMKFITSGGAPALAMFAGVSVPPGTIVFTRTLGVASSAPDGGPRSLDRCGGGVPLLLIPSEASRR